MNKIIEIINSFKREKKPVEVKNLSPYGYPTGSFSTVHFSKKDLRIDYFHSCRETFSRTFTATTKAFLVTKPKTFNINRIQEFFDIIEKRLGLRAKSKVVETSNKDCLLFQPCSFWTKSIERRQLLTILIRSAFNFNGKNFNQALYSYKYAKDTKPAIARFLKGFTKIKSGSWSSRGWRSTFASKRKLNKKLNKYETIKSSELAKNLIKPY